MSVILKSPAFDENDFLPRKYSAHGDNISPPLMWENIPKDTISFAVLFQDLDNKNFDEVHWIIYNIPANITKLKESIPHKKKLDNGICQGENSWGEFGFDGPALSYGIHKYSFKLYCVNFMLDPEKDINKKELIREISGRIIDQAELIVKYSR